MKREVRKAPKVTICRKCRGTGEIADDMPLETRCCPQCEGSGRVTVSCEMTVDIRPYRPARHNG